MLVPGAAVSCHFLTAAVPCRLMHRPASTAPADGLWWLGEGRAVAALRRVVLLASLAVFLAALEERVVFHSFNQYIRLTAPWNYLAVTGGWVGAAGVGRGTCRAVGP